MRRVARMQPDPAEQRLWNERADRFAMGKETANDSMLVEFGKGWALLLGTPLVVGGAAVFGVGAMLYGTGKIIIGFGHILTFGQLRRT